MKIAIESQRVFRRRKHGMDVVAVELIKQLQQIDTVNEYILLAKDGDDNNCIQATPNFTIKRIKGLTYGDWEQFSLPAALKKYKPDLIHCTANTGPVNCPIPMVLTLHDIIFLRETSFKGTAYQNFGNIYRRLIVPLVMKTARRIITVSEQEKQIILSSCDIDPLKVSVVHNAVDGRFHLYDSAVVEDFRKSFDLPHKFILHLGNTAPKKNTLRMIEAYARYADNVSEPLPLVVADYPPGLLHSKLDEMKRLGLRRNIHLPGYIPSSQMPLLYNCATLFVYPSLVESFGLPVLEAMACGKPVITSDVPALKEVAGDAALYVTPGDVQDIAASIAEILEDAPKYELHVQRGKERASLFNWKNSAQQVMDIYKNVLQ